MAFAGTSFYARHYYYFVNRQGFIIKRRDGENNVGGSESSLQPGTGDI
jgi:hypothetical protein